MAGKIKKLERSEGVTVTAPTDLAFYCDKFLSFASDAAFVTAKGAAAANGDVYYNTASDVVRLFQAAAWKSITKNQAAFSGNIGTASYDGLNYIPIICDTENFDTLSAYSTVNGSYTVPTGYGGIFVIGGFITARSTTSTDDETGKFALFHASINDTPGVQIGKIDWKLDVSTTADIENHDCELSGLVQLADGDKLEIEMIETMGGEVTIITGSQIFYYRLGGVS